MSGHQEELKQIKDILLNLKTPEKDSPRTETTVLRWVAGIVSAIVVLLAAEQFTSSRVANEDIAENKQNILLLQANSKNTNNLLTSLVTSVGNLTSEFNLFNRTPRFGKEHSKEAFENFYQSKIQPLENNVSRENEKTKENREAIKLLQQEIKMIKYQKRTNYIREDE